MSYGINLASAYHVEGNYACRVLKGEMPVDLPVQQSTKIEMFITVIRKLVPQRGWNVEYFCTAAVSS